MARKTGALQKQQEKINTLYNRNQHGLDWMFLVSKAMAGTSQHPDPKGEGGAW